MARWHIFTLGLALGAALLVSSAYAQTRVDGYFRRNGTYVPPHYRSTPDHNPYNNWSYPGNSNPYTGERATGRPDTYLQHYYAPQVPSSLGMGLPTLPSLPNPYEVQPSPFGRPYR
jgi:hypothetical protein